MIQYPFTRAELEIYKAHVKRYCPGNDSKTIKPDVDPVTIHLQGLVGELTVCRHIKRDINQFLDWHKSNPLGKHDIVIGQFKYGIKSGAFSGWPAKDELALVPADYHRSYAGKIRGYLFSHILDDCSSGWFLGYIDYQVFDRSALTFPAGSQYGVLKFKVRTRAVRLDQLAAFAPDPPDPPAVPVPEPVNQVNNYERTFKAKQLSFWNR